MTKFILLKYVKKPIIFKEMKPDTNNFLHSKIKYVKIDLFVMSPNNGLGLGFKTQTPPLILNIPPHIKHGASY